MSSKPATLKLTCPRCGVAMLAEVKASHQWPDGASPSKPSESYFAVCANCDEPFLAEYYEDRSKLFESLSVESAAKGVSESSWRWHKLYPAETISGAPEHLPVEVEHFYKEACGCLASGYSNAAGAIFRKTLEAATRTQEISEKISKENREKYNKSMLSARISALRDAGVIPGALVELVQTIKLEGNEAVHGMDTYTLAEAAALKEFVDVLLGFVFTMPRKMQAVRTSSTPNGRSST